MKTINSRKYSHYLIFFATFFLLASFLFLGNAGRVEAKDCKCTNVIPNPEAPLSDPVVDIHVDKSLPDTTDCKDYCPHKYPGNSSGMVAASGEDAKPDDTTGTKSALETAGDAAAENGECSFFSHPINCTLITVLKAEGVMLQGATALFVYIVDADSMKALMDNTVIYEVWGMVRDTLNILFILVLLFIAFATIFRIEKYGYKKILLTLVLMALLVNFSYPLVRIVIDFSNVLMYTLLRSNISGEQASSIPTDLAHKMGMEKIINPPMALQNSADSSFLLIAVIFVFIFMVSLLAVAVLLLIRAIALAILIMFSPVAFTGAIVPFADGKTGQYWSMLFKYAFFGPIMIFMLSVAIKFMNSAINHGGGIDAILNTAKANSISPTYVATIAFFAIPLVLIWLGIMVAQSMSIAGAGFVTKQAGRFMRWGTGLTFAAGAWQAYQNRRKQGDDRSWRNRLGTEAGSRQDQAWGAIGGKLGIGGRDARQRYFHDQGIKVKAASERHNMENLGVSQLNNLTNSSDKFERAAAIKALQGKNAFDTANNLQDRSAYQRMVADFGTESQVFSDINNGVKKKDPITAFAHIAEGKDLNERYTQLVNSNSWDPSNINYPYLHIAKPGEKLTKEQEAENMSNTSRFSNLLETGFKEGTITTGDVAKMKGKYADDGHRNMLKGAMKPIADNPDYGSYKDNSKGVSRRISRYMQMSYSQLNGDLSTAAIADETAARAAGNPKGGMISEMYRSANADLMKKAKLKNKDGSLTDHAKHTKEFVQNIPPAKIADVLSSIEDTGPDGLQEHLATELSKDPIKGEYMKNTPAASGFYRPPAGSAAPTPPTPPASSTPSSTSPIITGSKYGPAGGRP